jgi:phosphoserine phosphatase RsbU/P
MIEKVLRQVPLFATLPDSEIEYLAGSLIRNDFPASAVLMEEGVKDGLCFLIVDGSVEVIKAMGTSDEHLLGVREAGSLLGEMSLFSLEGAHTASVRALTPVSLLQITRSHLDEILRRQPQIAYEIIRLVSHRLEQAENLTIVDLRKKNAQLAQAYEELRAAQEQIIERERLRRELDIARDIQLSFLPPELPCLAGYQFAAMMVPARSVGGDMYDFIPIGEDQLGIVVGDVSDKGVPAALVMALTYSLLRAEAFRGGSPGDVLRAVNRLLLGMNQSGMFVTILYGVLDRTSGCFTYARAGHPYPLLMEPSGQAVDLPQHTGQIIGLLPEPLIDEGQLTLPEGGVLCLYTDGLSEAPVGPNGDEFEREGVVTALSSAMDAPAQDLCNLLWDKVHEAGPGIQKDDFTVVIIKRLEG